MTFEVVKYHKRLWIKCVESGRLVYTPPDFIRDKLSSREPMTQLARALTDKLRIDIRTIIKFEAGFTA